MVFCNIDYEDFIKSVVCVTILILVDGFLQYVTMDIYEDSIIVTILILVDGFLQ